MATKCCTNTTRATTLSEFFRQVVIVLANNKFTAVRVKLNFALHFPLFAILQPFHFSPLFPLPHHDFHFDTNLMCTLQPIVKFSVDFFSKFIFFFLLSGCYRKYSLNFQVTNDKLSVKRPKKR